MTSMHDHESRIEQLTRERYDALDRAREAEAVLEEIIRELELRLEIHEDTAGILKRKRFSIVRSSHLGVADHVMPLTVAFLRKREARNA